MELFSAAELAKLWILTQPEINSQFEYWLTVWFAVVVASFVAGSRSNQSLRFAVAFLLNRKLRHSLDDGERSLPVQKQAISVFKQGASMSKVSLSGYIIVPQTDLESVQSELPNHTRLTREEPGCTRFSVKQSLTDPTRFDVAEEFESKSAFEQHQLRIKASLWGKVTTNVERHYKITEEPAT